MSLRVSLGGSVSAGHAEGPSRTTLAQATADTSVPAIAYSHSKHLNPNWTETHPERAEIQQCT